MPIVQKGPPMWFWHHGSTGDLLKCALYIQHCSVNNRGELYLVHLNVLKACGRVWHRHCLVLISLQNEFPGRSIVVRLRRVVLNTLNDRWCPWSFRDCPTLFIFLSIILLLPLSSLIYAFADDNTLRCYLRCTFFLPHALTFTKVVTLFVCHWTLVSITLSWIPSYLFIQKIYQLQNLSLRLWPRREISCICIPWRQIVTFAICSE